MSALMTRKEIEIINAIKSDDLKKLRKITDCILEGSIKIQDEILSCAIKKGNLEMVQILINKCKFNLAKRSFFLALLYCENEIADYIKKHLSKI